MNGLPRAEGSAESMSRRDAAKSAGGLLAALTAIGLGSRTLAQDATPEAAGPFDGRYLLIRARQFRPDASVEDRIPRVREEFLPIIRAMDGYVAYFLFYNDETRLYASVSVFTDKATADASTAAAAEWSQQTGLADFVESVDPTILEGTILLSGEVAADG